MIKLLKNANVYAPEKLGKKDILIEGEKILLMQDTIEGYEGLPGVETYDLEGKTVVPAYIDMHVHITRNYHFSICRNNFHRSRKFRWIDVFCHRKYFFIYDQDITDSFWILIIQIRVFNQKHSGHRI